MIAVQITGGLGNQMLQYAAARALQLHLGTTLYLDTYLHDRQWFGATETPRSYELNVFPALREKKRLRLLPVEIPYPLDLMAKQVYQTYTKHFIGFSSLTRSNCYRLEEVEKFWALPDGTYLMGHFLSEQFFLPYADVIRRELEFPPVDDEQNADLLRRIAAGVSVSVHVRRSDYLQPASSNFSGVCDRGYYDRGMEILENSVTRPHYFIFSDDPEWARHNLGFPRDRTTVVDHNTGARSYEDLRLMSHCDHHIIANSTFSWWGAWLRDRPEKIVVAPQQWYKNYTGPSEDLIVPERWQRC